LPDARQLSLLSATIYAALPKDDHV